VHSEFPLFHSDAKLQSSFPKISPKEFRMRKFFLPGIICLAFIAADAPPTFAQSDAARLQGIITDQTNALVPGAKVKVTAVATNRILETTSGADTGAWSFPVLPPGDYVLENWPVALK
jgi:hypothetical protein